MKAVEMPESPPTPTPGDTYNGWLFKWTNYIKGYQRRWFVLSNGLLSYYRWVTCRRLNFINEYCRGFLGSLNYYIHLLAQFYANAAS